MKVMKFKHKSPSFALASSRVLGAALSNSVLLLYYSGRLPNRITLRSHKTWICPCTVWAWDPQLDNHKFTYLVFRVGGWGVHNCLPPHNPSLQLLGIPDHLMGSYTVGKTKVTLSQDLHWSEATHPYWDSYTDCDCFVPWSFPCASPSNLCPV